MKLVFITIMGMFVGCSHWKYHADLYDNAGEWINEEFRNQNPVGLAGDKLFPIDRTFTVNNQEEYSRIFAQDVDELAVDFETQMLVVYTFIDTYRRDNRILGMDVMDDTLKITYKMEEYLIPVFDACIPYQRWFVIIMNKLDINSVVFEKKR